MVNGLKLFKEQFQTFNDCYTVIGGTACSILMGNAALEFRATQDIDMILLVESRQFNEFAEQLLKFIDDGGYECEERKNGSKRLYRFITIYILRLSVHVPSSRRIIINTTITPL